ncbi:MAG: isochorismate synthase MenF [Rhodoluna sp.]
MKLYVATRELNPAQFSLLEHLPAKPTAFIRGGDGIVGWGEAARIESRAPSNRIQELSNRWKQLISQAEIQDSLQLPGTGLVAFGTFAFSDSSKFASSLIVPEIILGSRDGRVWLTTISESRTAEILDVENFWDNPVEYQTEAGVQFNNGKVSPAQFKTLVAKAIEEIAAAKFEKIVLARDIEAEVDEVFDLRNALKSLAKNYPTCWVYSVDGMFGASPELLVRVSHSQVSARVLAGTAGRGTDPGVDHAISTALAESAKNSAEHAFAVDSLVKSLEPFCTHVDADPKPFSLALPNLWHLASDVYGVLREDSSVIDLAASLHPTAAVAGTPTEVAKVEIEKLEQTDRGRYAGPVGWLGSDGDGEWAIALRGAQIDGTSIRAFAGCGIVAGSEPEAELAETELKFRPIREALA